MPDQINIVNCAFFTLAFASVLVVGKISKTLRMPRFPGPAVRSCNMRCVTEIGANELKCRADPSASRAVLNGKCLLVDTRNQRNIENCLRQTEPSWFSTHVMVFPSFLFLNSRIWCHEPLGDVIPSMKLKSGV